MLCAVARVKVDELTSEGKLKDEEIERLKALLAAKGDSSDGNSDIIMQLNVQITNLKQGKTTAEARITDLEAQLREARAAGGSTSSVGGDSDALQRQLTSMREQLQSQSKLFSDQMENGRKRP